MYACVSNPPIPILLWCDHFQTSSLVERDLAPNLGPPFPLFSPFSPCLSPLVHLFVLLHRSPLPALSSFITTSFSSLPILFHPLFSHSRDPPSSWQILVIPNGPQGMLGFSRLSLVRLASSIPFPKWHKQLEYVFVTENHKIKYTPCRMAQSCPASSLGPCVPLQTSKKRILTKD